MRSRIPSLARPGLRRCGLTLLELLAVLMILAITATIAVTATSSLLDQSRYEATQGTLEGARDAVLGDAEMQQPDGSRMVAGFVADLGRLPNTVAEDLNGDGAAELTLGELWSQPAGVAAFEIRAAVAANVDFPARADPQVMLGCGWRGPYVRLPIGNVQLFDGWGQELQLLDPAGDPILAAGVPIAQVFSPGRDGYGGDLRVVFQRTLPAEDHVSATLAGQVRAWDPSTSTYIYPKQGEGDVSVRLFAPNPNNGLIRVLEVTIADSSLDTEGTTPANYAFDNLTIGPSVVRAYRGTQSSEIQRLILFRGGQTAADLHLR